MKLNKVIAAALSATVLGFAAEAREQGVAPTVAPGNTIGVPAAATPPEGLYWMHQLSFVEGKIVDNNGDPTGLDGSVKVWNTRLFWAPGVKVLGGDYRAWIGATFVGADQTANAPLPPFLSGEANGVSQIEIHPINISWQTQPGTFVNAGFALHTPAPSWNAADTVHTGGNFWSVSANAGFAHISNGWFLGGQMRYFHNFENPENNYKSGDEIHLNLTALRDVGKGWSIGPVAYGRWQVTDDKNNGGVATYGGATFDRANDVAVGLAASKQFRSGQRIDFNYTHSVKARNSLASDHTFTVNYAIPLTKR